MNSTRKITYILEMTEEEAKILVSYTQNPKEDDPEEIRKLKEKLFRHLTSQGCRPY